MFVLLLSPRSGGRLSNTTRHRARPARLQRASGPGDRLGAGLKKDGSPNPRGRSPFFIWAGSGGGVRVDFHRDKIDRTTRGFQGVHPLTRLCLLSSCEERRWPSGQTCIKRLFGLSAHTMRHPAEKDIECAATSFLRVENTFGTSRSERSKETLRGCPHKHPGWSAGFLFRKTGGYDIS